MRTTDVRLMQMGAVAACFLERNPAVTLDVVLGDRYVDLVEERIDVAGRIGKLRDFLPLRSRAERTVKQR